MITEQQIRAYKINENGYKPLSSDKHKDSPMAFQMAASDYLWDVVLPHCQLLQQHQADHGNLHPCVLEFGKHVGSYLQTKCGDGDHTARAFSLLFHLILTQSYHIQLTVYIFEIPFLEDSDMAFVHEFPCS
ncbi:hypothetical protein V8G54_002667 [Vigna mungo]|uniref:Uncharacterized protein n=1 Tax=Vigna mungo TaxID=3915 RepID=A0AAQ3SC38_VIGMU